MNVDIDLEPVEGTDPDKVDRLLMAAEYCCVVLQTLRNGVPIEWKRQER